MLQSDFKHGRGDADLLEAPESSPNAEHIHHRVLEGILLRLARSPHAPRLILRGGMLMRLWFRPIARRAADLDVVSTDGYSVEQTAQQFRGLLADRDIDDGVAFDTERFRAQGIWLNSDFPGVRMMAAGAVDGIEYEFSIDVTFGEPLVPAPTLGDYPSLCGQRTARIWMCRPETIIGRKLHALMHMGMLHWRAKDLNDLRLLLGRVPVNVVDLPEAIATSFTSRGNTTDDARRLFGSNSWWTMKTSSARWHDFVKQANGQPPRNLASVVAEVSERLQPILERLP